MNRQTVLQSHSHYNSDDNSPLGDSREQTMVSVRWMTTHAQLLQTPRTAILSDVLTMSAGTLACRQTCLLAKLSRDTRLFESWRRLKSDGVPSPQHLHNGLRRGVASGRWPPPDHRWMGATRLGECCSLF